MERAAFVRSGLVVLLALVVTILAGRLLLDGGNAGAQAPLPVARAHASGRVGTAPVVTERVDRCASERFASGVQARFCATSVLGAAGRPGAYGPQNLFDGNPATAWCEGVPGPGQGEQIQIAFSRPQVVEAITFVNGYAKPANLVHTLSAIWPDGTVSSIELPNQRTPFVFTPAHRGAVTGLRLRIESVNGSRWPDTCLTEVHLSLAKP